MRFPLLSFALLLVASPVFGQGTPAPQNSAPQYPTPQYTAPVAPVYPGYGMFTNTATAAQGALEGMADVASAAGSYNLQTSEANINQQEANRLSIQNQQIYADTYYQMRAEHDAYEAKKHPRPTEEQLVHLAREGIPKPLPSGSLDQVAGTVNWPELLQYPEFAEDRKQIETMLKFKTDHGSLGAQQSAQFTQAVEDMAVILKRGISKVPPQKYMESYDFLKSLLYSTTQNQLP
ncbi:hypothetical protein AB1L30_19280 [Bremerella sp. JC817]|uniref:hypothetical protein n=1 Tax=Bremerella sp. JC817 TaxID=3231756 RepID=UPI003458265F